MPMGRPRTKNVDLPPRLRKLRNSYFFEKLERVDGRRVWQSLGSDRAAALAQWAVLYGRSSVPETGTFAAVAERYRREALPEKGAQTQRAQGRQLTYLIGVFGEQPVSDITPQEIRQWLDVRGQKARVAANREKALLSHVLTKAREWGIMNGANPCAGIKGRGERPRTRYVTDAEMALIVSKADTILAVILQLAYLTAQRPADVLKLRRSDVRDGFLHVEQNKTGAKLRIALEGELAELLQQLMAGRAQSIFLVSTAKGNPITAASLRKRFDKAREASGIDFQFRDLRAKAATDADSLTDAQALLGHAAATTTDRYIRARVGRVVKPIDRKL